MSDNSGPQLPPEPTLPLNPTAAADWKSPRKMGFVIPLPSGNACRMRRTLNLRVMAESGAIPNPLAKDILSRIDPDNKTVAINFADLSEKSRVQTLDLIDRTVVEALVEPTVEIPPETDEDGNPVMAEFWQPTTPGAISIMDLSVDDKFYIFAIAQGAVDDLRSFREQQARSLHALQDVREVLRTPKPDARPKRARSGGKRSAQPA